MTQLIHKTCCLGLLFLVGGLRSQELASDVSGQVSFSVTDTETELVPELRELHSIVELEMQNRGPAALLGPLQLGAELQPGIIEALGFTPGPDGLVIDDLDGVGDFPVGAVMTQVVAFVHEVGAPFRYRFGLFGSANKNPVVDPGGPYRGVIGEPLIFAATAVDPEGEIPSGSWAFEPGVHGDGLTVTNTFSRAGTYSVHLEVSDGRGGLTAVDLPVTILPSLDFALARTRTLTGDGVPLPDVTVTEEGPEGTVTYRSGSDGFLSLGQGVGVHT